MPLNTSPSTRSERKMDVSVDISLSERRITVGVVSRTLSNYNIKYLRRLVDGAFTDETATAAAEQLLREQIIPFIRKTGRRVSVDVVEQEVEEAFDAHLYSFQEQQRG